MITITPPLRGQDSQGSGEFGAPRGNHTHQGIDLACMKDSLVRSVSAGSVTKIGYPYNPEDPEKGHLRYVQVTDRNGFDVRYFYIEPMVKLGDSVLSGYAIGKVQGLTDIYKGITDHFHFEVKQNGKIINPHTYLG